MDYYTLWVHQIKTPIAASQLLLGDVTDSKTRALLEQEVFKIDAYTNLVLRAPYVWKTFMMICS